MTYDFPVRPDFKGTFSRILGISSVSITSFKKLGGDFLQLIIFVFHDALIHGVELAFYLLGTSNAGE